MHQPLAFLNGSWIPAAEAKVSAIDTGFVLGVTIAEQLRTFGGRIFHLGEHLRRMRDALEVIGVDPGLSDAELADIAQELVARNHRLLDPADDLGLSIFVTPGDYPSYSTALVRAPTVCLHTYALPFRLWANKYTEGQPVAVTGVRQVPAECWPPHVKCRSRMHYYLADREAAAADPGARAVLRDARGAITEASTANVIVYRKDEGLISPPQSEILHGISLAVTFELARHCGIPTRERTIHADELAAADEVLLTSTPLCLLPATRCNGAPIADGRPGPVFDRLLLAWNTHVGLDLAAQARRFADREQASAGATPV